MFNWSLVRKKSLVLLVNQVSALTTSIHRMEGRLMSASQDLADIVVKLSDTVQSASDAIAKELAALADAHSQDDSAAVEASVSALKDLNDKLASAVASTVPAPVDTEAPSA